MALSKLRQSAKGRDCEIRIPGACNSNPETVVLCHVNGGGMGMKHPDLFGAFGCSSCHDVVDGRREPSIYAPELRKLYLLEGIMRTQQIWINEGLIGVK